MPEHAISKLLSQCPVYIKDDFITTFPRLYLEFTLKVRIEIKFGLYASCTLKKSKKKDSSNNLYIWFVSQRYKYQILKKEGKKVTQFILRENLWCIMGHLLEEGVIWGSRIGRRKGVW